MPKEMLPILDKPLVQYAVEEAVAAGLTEIGFVTGRGKRAIEDHFDVSFELEYQVRGTHREEALYGIRSLIEKCTFAYTRQSEVLGLGHAVSMGQSIIGDEPFAVVLADDLCFENEDGVLSAMVRLCEQHKCSVVAVESVPLEMTERYGIIEASSLGPNCFKVAHLVEKPNPTEAPSTLAVIGRYVLTPDIFDDLRKIRPGVRGEIQLTDALNRQAGRGKVLACRFSGIRFDCGSVEGFVNATNHCFQQRKNLLD